MPESRWDPFGEMIILRDAVDRVLRDSAARAGGFRSEREGWFPVELGETADGYVVRAPLPGVKPEDVQVMVHGQTLTISGTPLASELSEVQRWLIRDRQPAGFRRSLRLPSTVDVDRAQARTEHGLMVLTLPRAPVSGPRRVPVVMAAGEAGQASGGSTRIQDAPNFAGSAPAAQADASGASVHHSDVVTEASDLSFPASDPPSWTPGHPGGES